ncbi:NADH-quinone oxidoreductase subunit A [Glycomyces sp. TRM65418]|uniref:NADH-quinone oxidoreductase subunit A n=1 Tax=Glycomyces sp. TRM65418 TaxID=2867006 RepID=UPI001CE6FBE8|nr:NADH-quinone oxidoreductase subunit A [Glycomyces sp. TRM65418]MCC3763663.1 NADH-quinone oxidoreductase subunit A [Glycomyces sp. TRM65418]QZD57645.1 NADH-quinone oxidoreductase subunit A [Glycomyces sp. TRM65418]
METSGPADYLTFGVLLLTGFAFVAVAMTANRILRPSAPSADKAQTYECGVDPAPDAPPGRLASLAYPRTGAASPPRDHVGKDWAQVQIRYYVYAFLFVLFAVEAVFLFPWAAVFRAFGTAAAVEMGVFVGVLALGLAYAWRKGVLRWR